MAESSWPPSGQDPKDERPKGEGSRSTRGSPSLGGSCQRKRQQGHHADQTPWRRVCARSRRGLTSWVNHRWSDDCGEPGEVPTWPGCRMERESRNTLAVTGGRGGALSTAHRRPNSENARPRASGASPMPSSQCTVGPSEKVARRG